MDSDQEEDYDLVWRPVTSITGKDETISELLHQWQPIVPKRCWHNARQVILGLDHYAEASYVEGVVALEDPCVLIEHGWICTPDGIVIDPTLPRGVAAYFPGLEFRGREGIAAFLDGNGPQANPHDPFHYAFGFCGSKSPSYRAAWEQAWAYHQGLAAAPG